MESSTPDQPDEPLVPTDEVEEEVQPEDFENDPSRNPDDPEWEALKGG